MLAAVSPLPNRASAEQRVMIRFTIEADNVTRVRHAVVAACGDSVELLRTQIVPHSSQVRVLFVLANTAAHDAMLAVMRAVPHGEIGPVFQKWQDADNTH